jgi:hypothetical protein
MTDTETETLQEIGAKVRIASEKLAEALASRIRRAARKKASKHGASKPSALYSQRCAVRVTYSQNRTHGQCRAHGKYLERESAQHGQAEQAPEQELQSENGFTASASGLPIASTLARWQAKGDPRFWKLIISPENPSDLVALTRKTMAGMERELGSLEWVAIIHRNTDHHHVHVVLRGVDERGQPLMIPPEIIRRGIRAIAEHEVTAARLPHAGTGPARTRKGDPGEALHLPRPADQPQGYGG